ncbi:hypothetical protein D9M68_892960 [compost metagenome]
MLGLELLEIRRNATTRFLEGDGLLLVEGPEISVDLRLRVDEGSTGWLLVLTLNEPCIRHTQVREHYPDLIVAETPRGRSPEEQTVFSTPQAWGQLAFGFRVASPDWLASVILQPT